MSNVYTLQDLANRSGNPKSTALIETMKESNEALDDMLWQVCNSGNTHVTTVQAYIPSPAWRKLNDGVPMTKGGTKQLKASCGMLETYSEVDKKLVELAAHNVTGGDSNAAASEAVARENKMFIQGFGDTVNAALFYAGAKPEEPTGLSYFYNKLGDNVLDGGGTKNLTSIWFVSWDEMATTCLYPQGTVAGLKEEYLGQITKQEGDKYHEVLRTHYTWDLGFVPRDQAANVRIANIDVSSLGNPENMHNLVKLMIRALHRIPSRADGYRKAIYMHRDVLEALDLYSLDAKNVRLKESEMFGRKVKEFYGIPIRRQNVLKLDESKLTA